MRQAPPYAYFTTTGTGTATATVGSQLRRDPARHVVLDPLPGRLLAGHLHRRQPVLGQQRVGTISLASITVDAGHSTCSTVITGGNPDFTMPAVTVNKTFATGNGQAVTPTGTLTMNDTGVSQDACQGATLTLNLTSN